MAVRSKRVTADVIEHGAFVQGHRGAKAEPGRFVSATGKGVVSATMKNYAADPFFLKKAAEAKAEIDKVGLPKTKK